MKYYDSSLRNYIYLDNGVWVTVRVLTHQYRTSRSRRTTTRGTTTRNRNTTTRGERSTNTDARNRRVRSRDTINMKLY